MTAINDRVTSMLEEAWSLKARCDEAGLDYTHFLRSAPNSPAARETDEELRWIREVGVSNLKLFLSGAHAEVSVVLKDRTPPLPDMAPHAPTDLRISEAIYWATQTLERLNAKVPRDPLRWGTNENWTNGLGRKARLEIRNNPGLECAELRAKLPERRGIAILHEYLAWLGQDNGTPYRVYCPGKGYYMSVEAYRVWSQYDNPGLRRAEYDRWLNGLIARHKAGDREALPYGYDGSDD